MRSYEVLCRGALLEHLPPYYDHLEHLLIFFFKEFYLWNRLVYYALCMPWTLFIMNFILFGALVAEYNI